MVTYFLFKILSNGTYNFFLSFCQFMNFKQVKFFVVWAQKRIKPIFYSLDWNEACSSNSILYRSKQVVVGRRQVRNIKWLRPIHYSPNSLWLKLQHVAKCCRDEKLRTHILVVLTSIPISNKLVGFNTMVLWWFDHLESVCIIEHPSDPTICSDII